jgi:15-cis-phytoene synthase
MFCGRGAWFACDRPGDSGLVQQHQEAVVDAAQLALWSRMDFVVRGDGGCGMACLEARGLGSSRRRAHVICHSARIESGLVVYFFQVSQPRLGARGNHRALGSHCRDDCKIRGHIKRGSLTACAISGLGLLRSRAQPCDLENESLKQLLMLESIKIKQASDVWTEDRWRFIERDTRELALSASTEEAAYQIITRQARAVMRAYSTSFFIVTRFLPAAKRAKVEAIYASVRYPDEIVDTFPISKDEQIRRLNLWAAQYEMGLAAQSIKAALEKGVPCFLASFTRVVRDEAIPPVYYHAFIEAMRRDVHPRRFNTIDDLIDSYIYGSAIVVGYFLTYVYGPRREEEFDRALTSARHLGIALQLTNFLRDVGEDQRRGRVYLPLDLLRAERIQEMNVADHTQRAALNRVLRRVAMIAEDYYARASADLDAFAADSQAAIRACINVYRQLNDRIGHSPEGILHRESVPLAEKFKVLPPSKYWRLPVAYLFEGR